MLVRRYGCTHFAARSAHAPQELRLNTLPQDAALLVIDVQEAFTNAKWGARNNPDAEANIATLIGTWRETGRPIIHVRHISNAPGSLFAREAPSSRIKDVAAPKDAEPLIEKHQNSAFIGTDLEQRLRSEGIRHVVIVGLTTDHCVSTTARMAGNFGFVTFVVDDATATFERTGPTGMHLDAQTMHDVNLASLNEEFASVVTTEQVLSAAAAVDKRMTISESR